MDRLELLKTTFEALKSALKECNSSILKNSILDEYSGFSLHGTVETKTEILTAFSPGGVQISEYTTEQVEYLVDGNIGIVTGRGYVEGNYGEFDFSHHVMFTDIFRYKDGEWKYFRSQVTEIASSE